MISVLLAVLAAATNAASSVLQRKANLREVQAHRTGWGGLADLLRQPLWLAGIGAVVLSFLLQAGALSAGELSEVQPLMSLELPLTLLLASVAFHRRLGRAAWTDIGAMSVGLAVFLFSLSPTEGAPGGVSGTGWVLGAGGTGAVLAVLAVVAVLSSGVLRASLFGVSSGIAFALTAVFISAALAGGLSGQLFARWQLYLVAVAGLTAMVLLQEGMQAGTLVAVQPGVTLSDPVVAVILGVLLFHERVRTGWWIVPELVGAAAVAWGAVRLSRSLTDDESQTPDSSDEEAPAGRSASLDRTAGRDAC